MSLLSVSVIKNTQSDQALFELLGRELELRLPNGREATDAFVAEICRLPLGLGAMASVYELSVSLALDDLGWHFGNHHHKGLACKTEMGLRELGAIKLAEIFAHAHELSDEYWQELGQKDWRNWYINSPLQESLKPLNNDAWNLQKEKEILDYWVSYAREHPERCVDDA